MLLFLVLIIGCLISAFVVNVGFVIPAIILFLIMCVVNYVFMSNQINDLCVLEKCDEEIKILTEQRDNLLPDLKKYLGELYPSIEKDIFNSMAPTNEVSLRIYMAKYPEIKSDKILTLLVNKIETHNTRITEHKMDREWRKANIKARLLNARAWTIPGIIKPSLDK